MNRFIKIYLFTIVIISLIYGCTNFSTDPPSGENSNVTLDILSPVENDTIGAGITEINYLLSATSSLKFIELYVNGNFVRNYPPNPNGLQPNIYLDINDSFIGSSINYHLIYYDFNETSFKSEDVTNVQIVETVDSPQSPYNLKILILTATSINLSWQDSSLLVNNYEIWRKINFDGVYQKYLDVNGNVFNINDENLDPAVLYSYVIKSINQYGESSFSEEANTFGVGSSGDLYPPTNLIATARGTQLVKLSWKDNSTDENLFSIERRINDTEFIKIGLTDKNTTAYTDSSDELITGGKYYYRVKAYSNSDSAWSNESFVQTYWYDIIKPTNLRGIYLGDGKILLTWNDNDNTNTLFEIERKKDGEEQFTTIATIPGNQNTFLDENLTLLQNYTYRIRSGDGVYYSEYSNEITLNTGNSNPL